MSSPRASIRFSVLTALVWILVAGGTIFLLWTIINQLSSRYLPLSTATPGRTQVYQTIAAMLTAQSSISTTPAVQTITPSPTSHLTQNPATHLPTQMFTSKPEEQQTDTAETLCDQAAAGNPIDITIPDDSLISPGQGFTKTWKLVNAGSCTWTTSYYASFFYGDRMDAPETVPLDAVVLPAQSVEISIEMTAPRTSGTFQGNWKLSNPDGVLFGIGPNGDAPFWVRIVVENDQTDTPSPTSSLTPTIVLTEAATATGTPPGESGGRLSPNPGDSIDLDTLTLNSHDSDLLYQTDTNNLHWLVPHEDAKISIYGNRLPALADCRSAHMSTAPVGVESLVTGTYLCYVTSEGRLGRMLLEAIDPDKFTLVLDLLTWPLQ